MQDLANALNPRQAPQGSPGFYLDGDVEEEVVDINTSDGKFYSYLLHLKKKIQGVWVYPKGAANSGIGGQLKVEFLIAKNGQLIDCKLLDSSGHHVLDHSAVSAIQTAAPYNPLPRRLRTKRLRIRANFIYVTQSFFRRIM
ncbi:energy transducer TonB [Thermodesulfobacteriota bacterium]